MTIYVCAGPTICPQLIEQTLDAVVVPPAAQGDIYRLARHRPFAIGIVDGYFERVPSVWHKEILWALEQGIHVFGSSSMGALRAAELDAFGMVGIGWIYRAYRDGALEDDDEVAVAHGPAESGYRAVSEAMVNIRRTLARAHDEGIITEGRRDELIAAAKELSYADRTLAGIGDPPLVAWLRAHRVDQKRLDALAMLHALSDLRTSSAGAFRPKFQLAPTESWRHLQDTAGAGADVAGADGQQVVHDGIIDELCLEPNGHAEATRAGMLRHLLLAVAERNGVSPAQAELNEAARVFRRERGLLTPAQVTAWMEDNDLQPDEFRRLLFEQAQLEWARRAVGESGARSTLDHLRISSTYAVLKSRTCAKRATRDGAEISEQQLVDWYFRARTSGEPPVDLDRFARDAGFSDASTFVASLRREYWYQQHQSRLQPCVAGIQPSAHSSKDLP